MAQPAHKWCTSLQRTRPGCCSPTAEKWWGDHPDLDMPTAVREGIDVFKEMEGYRHQNVTVAPEIADQAEPPDEDEDVLVQTHESINAARARRRRTTTEDVPAGTPATTTTDSRAAPTPARAATAASGGPATGAPKRTNYKITDGPYKGWTGKQLHEQARRIATEQGETVASLGLSKVTQTMSKQEAHEWLLAFRAAQGDSM